MRRTEDIGTTHTPPHPTTPSNKIRVRLGVLTYKQFKQLLPGRARSVSLAQLVRSFVGPALDFELQLVLARAQIPRCKLKRRGGRVNLGWNTWLFSRAPVKDAADAVLACAGLPNH